MTLNVLVAGNDARTVGLAKSALESLEVQIIPAPAMSLALFLAHKNFPELILCNFNMVDGDAFEFLKELKVDSELQTIPFIFVAETAPDENVVARARSLGAEAVLSYPLEPAELKREVIPYINIRLAEKQEREPQTPE